MEAIMRVAPEGRKSALGGAKERQRTKMEQEDNKKKQRQNKARQCCEPLHQSRLARTVKLEGM